jgi:hypothetical protein
LIPSRGKIIETNNGMAVRQQTVRQIAANETGTASNKILHN